MMLYRIPKPNTNAAAILWDKLYPTIFEHLSDTFESSFAQLFSSLQSNNGLGRDVRSLCELNDTPTQCGARQFALDWLHITKLW